VYLILGLGNPGPRYELTRHNIGFLVVDNLAEKYRIRLTRHRHQSLYGSGDIGGRRVWVAKPMTYMNESGRAARSWVSAAGIFPENVIVVHDDIDLPLGKIKVKHQGGDAGQRGVRSIIQCLDTDRFTRVRLGIGRPQDRDDIIDYVLTPFTDDELDSLNPLMEQAVQTIENTLQEFNHRTIPKEKEEETE